MALGRPLEWLGLVDLVDRLDLGHLVDLEDLFRQLYLGHHWYRLLHQGVRISNLGFG
jgi:hypothetical protein